MQKLAAVIGVILVSSCAFGAPVEILTIDPTNRTQNNAGVILNNATNKFTGTFTGNLTGTASGNATGTPLYVESDPTSTGKVSKTGDTMTGPLTNTAGYYGDGSHLTNLPSTGEGGDLGNLSNAVLDAAGGPIHLRAFGESTLAKTNSPYYVCRTALVWRIASERTCPRAGHSSAR